MKTVRRLLYRDVVWSVVFVAIAFLSLFFFIDFLEELEGVGRQGYTVWHAALAALFELPGRFYELFPIAVLIGTIYAMARLAQSSEFTILRTGGLGPGRALSLLLTLGVVMGVLTFVMGEYVAPLGEQQAAALKTRLRGGQALGRTGAWLKERRGSGDEERSISINVQGTSTDGQMRGIRIFEHDGAGELLRRLQAATGRAERAQGQSVWRLQDVQLTEWPRGDQGLVTNRRLDQLDWPTTLEENVVAAAISPIRSMSTIDLWRYSRHLQHQEQAAQRYELQFWRRAFYPLACIVMVALALPFAYLHARAGGISLKVFGGIMLGISFVLLNNVVGHLGLLRDWTPWLASALPSLLYLLMSMAAFTWLVRYR
ncbi:LPS export ABC transporter permease LptG [Ideonella sp.]|uniref:LPS export ABC transporter permease LptG n=1 Tax=Ideonella sp. TaxID=1929293 RepID=UPI002B483C8B|nr:LPS export ABC transporter permease LptG [Ideonella sp.]HJV68027.1 LPS export ABC transporter permease LptG [Ideonella sp.]